MSKFQFRNSTQKGMSWRSSDHAVDGSVFIRFRNSIQGVMSWRSSASAIPLRREYLHSAVEGNVVMKFRFCNSPLKVMPWRSSTTTLIREFLQTSASAIPMFEGSVFMKFRNCAVWVLSFQSSASATPLRKECHHHVLQFRC